MPHVREKPPLRLHWDAQAPSGRHFRWGPDEPDPSNVPSGERFSTTIPGGFETAECVLPRKPGLNYSDLERLSTLRALGPGGEVAWEGRLERAPRVSGEQLSVSPSAVGNQALLEDDKSAREIYVDRDLSRFAGQASNQRRIDASTANTITGAGQVVPDESGTPALIQQFERLENTASHKMMLEAWYDARGIPLDRVYYDLTSFDRHSGGVPLSGGWIVQGVLCDSDRGSAGGGIDSSGDLGGSGSGYLVATAATRKWLALEVYYDDVYNNDGTWWVSWRKLAAYGRHGLTRRGSDPGGFYASDVIPHVLSTWAPLLNYSEGSEGTIQPSGFVIPQMAFLDYTTAAEIIRQANRFHLRDWAVWEDKTFYYHDRGARGRSWRARSGPAQLEETGPQVDRLWESVVVQYQDVDGTTRTVGPVGSGADTEDSRLEDSDPENPATLLGITRRDLLVMGTGTAASATEVGARFLEEQKLLDRSGRAQLMGHVEDDRGVLHPAWKVRAGDTISFVDAADSSPRRIVKTDYTHSTRTCAVDLDSPPEGLASVLERLGVVLVPLGLG